MKKNRKKKIYIPKKRFNPAELANRIEVLQDKIDKQKQQKDLILKALENHFEYLVNFTSHDMKNCLQNLDSVVYNIDIQSFNQDTLDTIVLCLKNIRTSLDEFNRLVPNSKKIIFELSELGRAVEIINKNTFSEKGIRFILEYDKKSEIKISQPFHTLLQILNNLIINAIKAIDASVSPEKVIKIKIDVIENDIIITVADTGIGIAPEVEEKIFQIYFSTTGGSGIGLFHARVALEEMKGEITLSEKSDTFNTVFKIKFPIRNE